MALTDQRSELQTSRMDTDDNDHQTGKCKLPGCAAPRHTEGNGHRFDFCRKAHALKYKEICSREWAADGRMCKFSLCTRHIYVDPTSLRRYDYCGFQHAMLAASFRGLDLANSDKPTVSTSTITTGTLQSGDCARPRQNGNGRSFGQEASDEQSLADCLLHAREHGRASNRIFGGGTLCFGENVLQSHPWELLREEKGSTPKYFLVFLDENDRADRKTGRFTKSGFRWKQTGTSYIWKNKTLEKRYFRYGLCDTYTRSSDEAGRDQRNEHVNIYLKQRDQNRTGQEDLSAPSRWILHEISLTQSDGHRGTAEMQSSTSSTPRRPVIWKIYQNLQGKPEWPPLSWYEECRETPQSHMVQPRTIGEPSSGVPMCAGLDARDESASPLAENLVGQERDHGLQLPVLDLPDLPDLPVGHLVLFPAI